MTKSTRIIAVCCVCMSTLLLDACKKKEPEPEYKDYMTGALKHNIPGYLYKDRSYTFTVSGITSPTEEEGVAYSWSANEFAPGSEEGTVYTCLSPVQTGTYSITVTASCQEYYDTQVTVSVIVIDTLYEACLTDIAAGMDAIMDPRDQHAYQTRTYGPLEWFVQNLNWAGAGNPYAQTEALSAPYGRLYSWNEATGGRAATGLGQGTQGVCPPGWSVPTNEDWVTLAIEINGGAPLDFFDSWDHIADPLCVYAKINDVYVWPYSPRNTKSNKAGWNGLPGGNGTNYGKNYGNLGNYGFWLSSSEADADNGYYRYIHYDFDQFPYHATNKDTFSASVRCVRLVQEPQEPEK